MADGTSKIVPETPAEALTPVGINHLVIQLESLDSTLADLAAQGILAEPSGLSGGEDGPRTS